MESTREAVLRDFARGAQPAERLARVNIAMIKWSTPPTASSANAAVATDKIADVTRVEEEKAVHVSAASQ